MICLKTRAEYLEIEKNAIGERDFAGMYSVIDNEYYELVEKEVKNGNLISRKVYESLSKGQQFHFNKHYNHRGDKIDNN